MSFERWLAALGRASPSGSRRRNADERRAAQPAARRGVRHAVHAATTRARRSRVLKSDSYTGVVPCGRDLLRTTPRRSTPASRAGGRRGDPRSASMSAEVTIRLDAMLRRSDRDLYVHPSTRLPGAVEIEAEIGRRLVARRPVRDLLRRSRSLQVNSTIATRTTRAIASSAFWRRSSTTW